MNALVADKVACHYPGVRAPVFTDVSITVEPGQILGLTGPSGVGKSSLARILAGLQNPTGGRVTLAGQPIERRRGRMSGRIGLLHQSPRSATNPTHTLGRIITEPARARHTPAVDLTEVTSAVGLTADLLDRFPSQVSDGQLQRACLARMFIAGADYLICDEPTAMLDAATTATVAALLSAQAARGVGVLWISHDHALLRYAAHKLVELDETTGETCPVKVEASEREGIYGYQKGRHVCRQGHGVELAPGRQNRHRAREWAGQDQDPLPLL